MIIFSAPTLDKSVNTIEVKHKYESLYQLVTVHRCTQHVCTPISEQLEPVGTLVSSAMKVPLMLLF